jgi:hypothetical protein
MVLWRHLLQGLVEGVRSTARSTAGGVGCLVQRGSLLALRAIFLRHGDQFSTTQWAAILEQTLLPAIRAGAENDFSPVVGIISESPSVSSVDFLVESPPLPPPADDMGLLKFEALNAYVCYFIPVTSFLATSLTRFRKHFTVLQIDLLGQRNCCSKLVSLI